MSSYSARSSLLRPVDPGPLAIDTSRPGGLSLVAPAFIVLLGYALRVWHLTSVSVCCDEINSLSFASRPLGDLLAALATFEPHPPFYYAFLHGWLAVVGQSEFALRYPSVLFSTLGIAAAYRFGRDIGGWTAGLASAAILATSQFSVLHAQDARMYAALQAWVALYLAGLVRYLKSPGRTSGLVVGFAGALAAFTHYHGLLVVALGIVPVVLAKPHRGVALRLVPFVAIACLYLPWVIFAHAIFLTYRGWMDVVSPLDILRRSVVAYSIGDGVGGAFAAYALFVLPALAFVGILSLVVGRQWRWLATLGCVGALPLAVVIAAALIGRPLYHERYLIVITPAYSVLAGLGLAWLGRVRLAGVIGWGALAGLAAVALPAYYWPTTPANPDFRASVALIEREAVGPAIVVMSPPQGPSVNYYLKDRLPSYTAPGTASANDVAAALAERSADRREAWFVRYSSGSWDDSVGRWLEAHAFYLRDRWVTQNHIVTYALASTGDLVDRPGSVRVDGQIDVSNVQTGPRQVQPGGRLLAGFHWSDAPTGPNALSRSAKVSLRLIDRWGQTVALLDRPLANPAGLTASDLPPVWQGALAVPIDAVPDHYRMEARFYNGTNGQGWPVVDASGEKVDAIDLGTVSVIPIDASDLDRSEPLDISAVPVSPSLFVQRVQLTGGPYSPDSTLVAAFTWAAQGAHSGPVVPELAVRSPLGQIAASVKRDVADQPYRLDQLRAGERIRERLDLPLRGVDQAGTYDVVLRTGADRAWASLGKVTIAVDPTRYVRPPMVEPRSDLFGRTIRLVGTTISSGTVAPGSSFTVSLAWQAVRLPTATYTVFIHLADSTGKPLAQSDGVPGNGLRPTSHWILGEYVLDEHRLTVPATAPPGDYRLMVGLYEADSGRRAEVLSPTVAGQAVDLGKVTVFQP